MTMKSVRANPSRGAGNLSGTWFGARAALGALVAMAVVSGGCFESDDAPAAVAAPAVNSIPDGTLSIQQILKRLESARKVLNDTIPQIEADNDRLAAELGQLEPGLTAEQADDYAKAFFNQGGVKERQQQYAVAAVGMREALDLILRDADDDTENNTLEVLVRGGIAGYTRRDFYDDYKMLANTPEAIGALEYVEFIFADVYRENGADNVGNQLAPSDPPSQEFVDDVFAPALMNSFVHLTLKENTIPSSQAPTERASNQLLGKVKKANGALSKALDKIEKFRKSRAEKLDVTYESYSLTKGVAAVGAFMSIWDLKEGAEDENQRALLSLLQDTTGAVSSAVGAYRKFVGVKNAPQWSGVIEANTKKISGALSIAVGLFNLQKSSAAWHDSNSAKAKMVADVMTTIGGCGAFVSLGPVGGVVVVVGLVAHFAADYFEKKEYAQAIADEKENVLGDMRDKLFYTGIYGQFARARAGVFGKLRADLLDDPDHKDDSQADTIQWLMQVSPSSFWSHFWPNKDTGDTVSFDGLGVIKKTFDLDAGRVRGLVGATAWNIADGEVRDAVVHALLGTADLCGGAFGGCNWSSSPSRKEILDWLLELKKSDGCNNIGVAGACADWKDAVQRAHDYLDDGSLPPGFDAGSDSGPTADSGAPSGDSGTGDDPGNVSFTHVSWTANFYECFQQNNVSTVALGGAEIGHLYTVSGAPATAVSSTQPGHGWYAEGTPCPKPPSGWVGGCCSGANPAGYIQVCNAWSTNEFHNSYTLGKECYLGAANGGPDVKGTLDVSW